MSASAVTSHMVAMLIVIAASAVASGMVAALIIVTAPAVTAGMATIRMIVSTSAIAADVFSIVGVVSASTIASVVIHGLSKWNGDEKRKKGMLSIKFSSYSKCNDSFCLHLYLRPTVIFF